MLSASESDWVQKMRPPTEAAAAPRPRKKPQRGALGSWGSWGSWGFLIRETKTHPVITGTMVGERFTFLLGRRLFRLLARFQ
jgi:hypothetical protein